MVRAYKSDTRARIWLDSGTEEGDAPQAGVADLQLLRDALVEKGWREGVDLRCTVVPGAGHNERLGRPLRRSAAIPVPARRREIGRAKMTILCLASYEKGHDFCARPNARDARLC